MTLASDAQIPSIEFYFDFNSTYSYLANARLAPMAAAVGVAVRYRPVTVLSVMKASGNPPTPACPAKFACNWIDARRWAKDCGIPLVENPHLNRIDTRPLGRIALGALRSRGGVSIIDALFSGFWGEGADMGDPAIVGHVLERRQFPAGELMAWSESEALDAELRANTGDAVARGAFGAPTFFVGEQMFFGNDRLDFVLRAATGSAATLDEGPALAQAAEHTGRF